MIYGQLKQFADEQPDHIFLQDSSTACTAAEALARCEKITAAIQELRSARIYLHAADCVELVLTAIAADAAGVELCILNHAMSAVEVEALLRRLGRGLLISEVPLEIEGFEEVSLSTLADGNARDMDARRAKQVSAIIILTTGTTSSPKAARHTWGCLFAALNRQRSEPSRWLLAYPLNHFAGIQVLLHVMNNRGTLLIPKSRDFDQIIRMLMDHRIEAVSATPTFWRMIVGRVTASQIQNLHLKRITLGGEPSTPDLLQNLKSKFPAASLTQVYATTELGTCFSVKDALAGFPASYLERRVGNVRLRIVDGELYVASATRMQGYLGENEQDPGGEWMPTGDLVEQIEARVYFRGRRSEVINVGGVKVHPTKVEQAILQIPGVVAARAYGKPNPISGQIVACDIELESDAREEAVREAFQATSATELNRYERPRQLNFVSRLERANEKVVRRA